MNAFSFTERFGARIIAAIALFSLIASMVPMQAFAASVINSVEITPDLGDQCIVLGTEFTVSGSATAEAGPGGGGGHLHQYHVQIDWGDLTVNNVTEESTFSLTNGQNPDKGTNTKNFSDSHTFSTVGNYTITARIYHSTPPGNDNQADAVATIDVCVVKNIDVEVSKTANISTPDENGQVTYTLTAKNNGVDSAENVVVTDTLEAGLSLASAIPAQTGTGPYTWSLGTLAGGASSVITVVANVNPGTGGQTLTNTASITTTSDETDDQNNTDSVDVTVKQPEIDKPSITITKQTLPDGDTTDFAFTLDNNALATLSDGESSQALEVTAGTYEIAETVPAGWALTNVVCTSDETGGIAVTADDGAISLPVALEDDIACTFTNTKFGSLTVEKQVANDAAGSFDFTVDGSPATLSDNQSKTASNLLPGTYVIVENFDDELWQTPSISCGQTAAVVTGGQVSVTLAAGENATCVYTNTPVPPPGEGFIIVKKIATFLDSAVDTIFNFNRSWGEDFGLVSGAQALFSFNVDDNNGPFSVTEDVPAGWSSTPVCTSDATQATSTGTGIMLVDGETVTCVFTNVELPECSNGINDDPREDALVDEADPGCEGPDDNDERDPVGSISIEKVVAGEGASDTQGFNFDYSWVDGDGADAVIAATSSLVEIKDLAPNEYVITEYDLPSRWNLTDLVCEAGDEDTDVSVNLQSGSVTIDLALGDNVDCVFTNTYTPRDSGANTENIIVQKLVTEGSDTDTLFTFSPSWSESDFQLSHGTTRDSGDLNADETYSVVENVPDSWTQTSVVCSSDADAEKEIEANKIFLEDDETITCVFTNTQTLYEIYGYVWHDDNRNEEWDGRNDEEEGNEEDALAGRTVRITNGEDTFETVTDENGYYEFNVPAGTWVITEELPSGWFQTAAESHTVVVPAVPESEEAPEENIMTAVMSFIIPTAHAQVVSPEYNFGNDRRSGGGGGTRIGDDEPDGDVAGISDDAEPTPMVLGEQVSAVPLGAADTGAGSTAPVAVELFRLAPVAFIRRK